jgi:M6 family metalloprotease-like protein
MSIKGNLAAITISVFCVPCFVFWARASAREPEFVCAEMLRQKLGKPCVTDFISSTGRHEALVIFTKFQGEAPEDSLAPPWAEDLFNPHLKGSFSHFYADMSRGALTIEGSVLKKRYSSEYGPEHYVASDPAEIGGYERFNQEILKAADAEVDFSKYDKNGDGYIDFVFIIVKNMPRNFIIGPAVGIMDLGCVFTTNDKGGPLGPFVLTRGATSEEGNFCYTVGVMAHEYGHALGLPDLYDLTIVNPEFPPEEDSAGIGLWGLMGYGGLGWQGDDGPNSFCAWSKAKLGWIGTNNDSLTTITENRSDLVITDIGTGGAVYRIPITGTEYFLLVNRQATGSYYERNIPQSGLLIWHIDETRSNNDEGHKKVDLECADGLFLDRGYPAGFRPDRVSGMDNLDFWSNDVGYRIQHYGNRGDATDLFDGERFTAFTPETNPSPIGYDKDTRVAVTNIRRQGTKMVVDIQFDFLNHCILKYTEWSGEIFISRDVTVHSSAILVIKPGTVIKFSPSDTMRAGLDPDRCELIVRGELDAQGSFFSPIIFTSAAPEPKRGDWYGIRLEGDEAKLKMDRSVIQYAQFGISGTGTQTCVDIYNSTIQHNQQDGINLNYPWLSFITLSGCKFQDNGSAAVKFTEGGVFTLQQCTISDNEWGIWGEGGKIEIRSSIIEGNRRDGIYLDSWQGEFHITDSQIRDNLSTGIRLIHHSELSDGIIKGNTISNNPIGISALSCSPRITENRLEGNDFAVQCEGTAVPQLDGFNHFLSNGYSILNLTGQEISAQNNWWGTADPDRVASQIKGPVKWDLYLRMDPNDIDLGFLLGQNFPNPFSSVTRFWYQIPLIRTDPQRGRYVVFTIYNILGQPVRRLFDGQATSGPHSLSWDGCDDSGREVASGVYIYRLTTEGFTGTGKAILSR